MKKITLLTTLFLLSFQAFCQQIVYVKNSATGTGTGESWENAYTDLITGIENAPENSEIWISIWTSPSAAQTKTQEEYIKIDKSLKLYGGFFGTETSKNQRSNSSYTRIDGRLDNNQVGFHAFRIQSTGVILDRFEVRNFNSEGATALFKGVIVVDSLASVTISNSKFENNEGGSLALMPKSETKLETCTFTSNNKKTYNSLITRYNDATLDINSSVFASNGSGGYVLYETFKRPFEVTPALELKKLLTVSNSNFISNDMAISFNYYGSASFSNCLFTLNAVSGNTINHTSDGSASFSINACTFNGVYSSSFIYAYNLKNFTYSNNALTNPSNSDLRFYVSNVKNTEILNSEFYGANGSQPFYFYSPEGNLKIENTKFEGGLASNQFLNVYVFKFEFKNSVMKNLSPLWGSYLNCDTVIIQNSTFDNLNSAYIFQNYSTKSMTYDSCIFKNNYLQETLFRNDQSDLTVKNCLIDNLSSPLKNRSRPLLFHTSSNHKFIAHNNKFSNISTDKIICLNYGHLEVFGNMFTNFETDTTFFFNYDTLKLYNCNLNTGSNLLVSNDTAYGMKNIVSFEMINTILYSDTSQFINTEAPKSRYLETISNTITNRNFSGMSTSSIPYNDFYLDEPYFDLFDKGRAIAGFDFPSKDLEGNSRIRFNSIDIGAIEYQSNITGVVENSKNLISSIYPNPVANGLMTISLLDNAELQFFDKNGLLIFSQDLEVGDNEISTEEIKAGLYFAKIVKEGASNTHKLIVK